MAVGIPLGPYRLLRRLATGGMAEIFLARQEGKDGFARDLVVKRILPHLAADPEFTRMFRGEARLAALLSHPNVVHVYDFGSELDGDGEVLWLAMELVRGVDLRALIVRAVEEAKERGEGVALPPHHAAKIVSFVCEALAHAHALRVDGRPAGVVHRDVTPSNVLVSFDGAVKLADFGIAKARTGSKGGEETEHGVVKGKLAYLSPEQARGEDLDARSDLFNVGILLFEAILGEPLFPHDDFRAAKALSASGRIPAPERIDRLPPALAAVVRRALAPRPEDRHPDALAMRAELEAYLRSGVEPTGTVELGRYVRELFPDALEEDARAPRAAGTVAAKSARGATSVIPAGTVETSPGTVATSAGTVATSARTVALRAPDGGAAGTQVIAGDAERTVVARRAAGLVGAPAGSSAAHPSVEAPSEALPRPGAPSIAGSLRAASSSTDAPSIAASLRAASSSTDAPSIAASPSTASPSAASPDTASPSAASSSTTTPTMPVPRSTARLPLRRGQFALAAGLSLLALAGVVVLARGPGAPAQPAQPPYEPPLPLPTVAAAARAELRVTSDPVGQPVFVDARPLGLTPALVSLGAGAHRVEIRDERGGVIAAESIELAPGEVRELTLQLPAPAAHALLRVDSVPAGASVRIGEVEVGTTPLVAELPPALHRVVVEREGFAPAMQEIELARPGERSMLSFALTPLPSSGRRETSRRSTSARATGTLTIATTPWSEVYLGSRHLGTTPLANVPLPAGRHVLTLRAPGRAPHQATVTIRANEDTRVRLVL